MTAAVSQRMLRAKALRLKWLVAATRFEIAMYRHALELKAGFNPDQPRDEQGRWTDAGGYGEVSEAADLAEIDQSSDIAPDQPNRDDLNSLRKLSDSSAIRPQLDQAWVESSPYGKSPQEHGFWISRNNETGDFFTRPFANSGTGTSIVPGDTPGDAVAFFHTHPNRPADGFVSGPSAADERLLHGLVSPDLYNLTKGCIILVRFFDSSNDSHKRDASMNAMLKIVAISIALFGMNLIKMDVAMSQRKCDLKKIADSYITKHFPSFDASGLSSHISEQTNSWEVTYELPEGVLGGAPVVTIEKRTCAVVRLRHTQ